MQEVPISKFKATCLSVLEGVRKTKKPVLITRFGEPVAEIVPPPLTAQQETRVGLMVGTGRITGDIVGPICDASDWDVLST